VAGHQWWSGLAGGLAPSPRRATRHPARLGRGLRRRGRRRAGQWRRCPLGLPGGRPEPGEYWADTLRREVREEACATVTDARLLGFSRGECVRGTQAGLVLVRALWRAEARPDPWQPHFEIARRRLVPCAEAVDSIWIEAGFGPLYRRIFLEAALPIRQ
jgi:ADP-ribose pyrophosphatase YjhB (NUDIX family)